MSVANTLNLLKDSDHESQEDHQSVASGSDRRLNSQLRSDLHLSGDEDYNNARSNHSSRHEQEVKQRSLPRSRAFASGVAHGEQIEEIPDVLQPPGTKYPRDQRTMHSTLGLE